MQYDLYIQVVDGQPVNYPALKSNLLNALGEIPANWEPFIRVAPPEHVYKHTVAGTPPYIKRGDTWVESWVLEDLTAEEKAAVQQVVKDEWANIPNAFNFTAWVYNEENNRFDPPIPRPTSGHFRWCGALNMWREAPLPADPTKNYNFDFVQWVYVEV